MSTQTHVLKDGWEITLVRVRDHQVVAGGRKLLSATDDAATHGYALHHLVDRMADDIERLIRRTEVGEE